MSKADNILKFSLTEEKIRNLVKECVKRILKEESLYDFAEDNEIDEYHLLEEFLNDKHEGKARYNWTVIQKEPYWNALRNYMTYGPAFRTPEWLIDNWLNIIKKNVLVLQFMTSLYGHSSFFPFEDFNDIFGTETDDFYEASEYLDKIGFYEWAVLPDGTDAMSDYGIEPICDILSRIKDNSDKSEKLIAINRILDVYHQRGDLASAFIEGGSSSCGEISNS